MKIYIIKHKGLFSIVVFSMLICSIMNIGMALIFKDVLDSLIGRNIEWFFKILLFYVVWDFLRCYTKYIYSKLSAKFLYKVGCSLKNDIFTSLFKKDIGDFKKDNSGKYISNLTNDVSTMNVGYFDNIFQIIDGVFSLVLGALTVAYINIYILLSIILFAFVNLLISMKFGKKLNIIVKTCSSAFEKFTEIMKDMFEGFEVIRSFNIENKINDNFIKQNNNVELLKLKARKKELILRLILDLIGTSTFLVAIGIGGYCTLTGSITVGAMMAATQLMNNIVNPIMNMGMNLGKLKSVKSVADKLDNLILSSNSKNDSNETIVKKSFENKVSFNNVSFSYSNNKNALNNISFKIEKGKKYALIGRSGSGKSTILKLLLKYYKDFEGDIKIDNTSINEIDSSSLYNLVSIIHQNVFMFDGTIKDNITLFQDYSNETLDKTIKASGLENMINSLPDKENSLVGENGCNLSGGEKQRLSIARALIKNTPILVLDEATSSLDNKTSHEIQSATLSIPDLTCITITHSFSENLLRKYDEIIVINDGEIVESGTFEELINSSTYFYSLYTINNPYVRNREKILDNKIV